MKLVYRITRRISLAMSLLLVAWGALFYFAVIEEVNDETDDMLEEYSEELIMRHLAKIPTEGLSLQSNNEFEFRYLSPEEALHTPAIDYLDSVVYVRSKHEGESARILKTVFYDASGRPILLTVLTPTIEKNDLWMTLLSWGLALWAILLLTIVGLNIFIYQDTMKPLYKMLNWLRNYRIGKGSSNLVLETETIEFRELHTALNDYTARAEDTFEAHKLFIGNMSHELQTPLSIVRHHLEQALEDDSLPESVGSKLAQAYDNLGYMARLNQTLLTLFRIEHHQYQEQQEIELGSMTRHILESYRDIYAHLNIQTELSGSWQVCMNEALAKMMISNLIKNAFVYNKPEGTILVKLQKGRLEVWNSSTREEPLEGDKVFSHFYQPERKAGSTGLGLALVKAICREQSLRVSYLYEGGMHGFVVSS